MRFLWTSIAFAFAVLVAVSRAQAAPDGLPLRIDIATTRQSDGDRMNCPTAVQFGAMVRSAEPRVVPTTDDSAPFAQVAFAAREKGGSRAAVTLRTQRGAILARTAEGADCETVAQAMALIVALQIGADSSENASEGRAAASEVHGSGATDAPTPSVVVPPRSNVSQEILPALGVRTGLGGSIAPSARISYGLLVRDGWPLAFRLGLGWSRSSFHSLVEDIPAFDADACPLVFDTRGRRFSLAGCVRGELGLQDFHEPGYEQKSLWIAGGLALRLRAALTAHLIVEIDGAGLLVAKENSVPYFSSESPEGNVNEITTPPQSVYVLPVSEDSGPNAQPRHIFMASASLGWSFF